MVDDFETMTLEEFAAQGWSAETLRLLARLLIEHGHRPQDLPETLERLPQLTGAASFD